MDFAWVLWHTRSMGIWANKLDLTSGDFGIRVVFGIRRIQDSNTVFVFRIPNTEYRKSKRIPNIESRNEYQIPNIVNQNEYRIPNIIVNQNEYRI